MIGQDSIPGQRGPICKYTERRELYVQRTIKRPGEDVIINIVASYWRIFYEVATWSVFLYHLWLLDKEWIGRNNNGSREIQAITELQIIRVGGRKNRMQVVWMWEWKRSWFPGFGLEQLNRWCYYWDGKYRRGTRFESGKKELC